MMKRVRRSGLAAMVVCLSVIVPAAADDAPWTQAQTLYGTAMSAYRGKRYEQALELFEQFLSRHGTHESIPEAHFQLAHCLSEQKKPGGGELIEAVLKKFEGSKWWFRAWRSKLGGAVNREAWDEYLDLLESFERQVKHLPLDYVTYWDRHVCPALWLDVEYDNRRLPDELKWLRTAYIDPGWERELLVVANTPQRAERILKVLKNTLKAREGELPANWQFVHYLLLQQAGKGALAEETLTRYVEEWGTDPRGLGLWLQLAEYRLERKETQAAEAAYAEILKRYEGNASLSVLVEPWLEYLKEKNLYAAFVNFTEWYLRVYPLGRLRGKAVAYWLAMVRPPALAGDLEARNTMVQLLDRFHGPQSDAKRRWMIDFHIEAQEPAEAVALARVYLDDSRWSRGTLGMLENYAKKCPPFGQLVAEAKGKYGIYEPAPEGEAAALLQRLQTRMKDEQVRHMEEIADEMFETYRETHETLLAVQTLADFYFKKVMPEPRDKWMARMFEAYPRHPLTEDALAKQIHAMNASSQYEGMGQAMDLFQARFPTGAVPRLDWFNARLHCYRATGDAAGVTRMLQEREARWERAAKGGSVEAMQELLRTDPNRVGQDANAQLVGDFWMKYADMHKGTRVELYCLDRAVHGYYHGALNRKGQFPRVDAALQVVERLRSQTVDPEIAWNTEFDDVNILSREGRVQEALQRIAERIKDRQKIRDLSLRLDFGALAETIEKAPKEARSVLAVWDRLRRICVGTRDQRNLTGAEARVFMLVKDFRAAESRYLKLMEDIPYPLAAYGTFLGAYNAAKGLGAPRAKALADSYLSRIRHCQEVVPGLLLMVGRDLAGNRDIAIDIRRRFASDYPDSTARGQYEAHLAKLAKK